MQQVELLERERLDLTEAMSLLRVEMANLRTECAELQTRDISHCSAMQVMFSVQFIGHNNEHHFFALFDQIRSAAINCSTL